MFLTFSIEDNFFTQFIENNVEVSIDRARGFLHYARKNARFVDCNLEGRFEQLNKDFFELFDSLLTQDIDLKKQLEIFWLDEIKKKYLFHIASNPKCSCTEANNCNFINNITQIRKKIPDFPKILITCNSLQKGYDCIPINTFHDSEIFKKYYDKTCYEEEAILDRNKGIEIIKKNWGSLIKFCKNEIKILDSIAFEKWDDNYKGGISQFVEVVKEMNPAIHLTIISRLGKHKSEPPYGDKSIRLNIKREINTFIKTFTKPNIEFLLCDKSAKFDHDRFILFDELIGAELGRGLDTFYTNSTKSDTKIDSYRIIYYNVNEVKHYMADPLRNITDQDDFKNIKNF